MGNHSGRGHGSWGTRPTPPRRGGCMPLTLVAPATIGFIVVMIGKLFRR